MFTNSLLIFGLLLLGGLLGGRLANLVKLPAVTGYLLIGVILGPSILGLVNDLQIESLGPISELALGVIAFTIGGEFHWHHLKRLGASVTWITLWQGLGAFFAVELIMTLVFHQPLYVALLLGAIATATAPAATMLVIREYKAKGPLTETLVAVVAMDDALGIIVFGAIVAICKAMTSGVQGSLLTMLGAPVWELLGSIVLGALSGLVMVYTSRRTRGQDELVALTLGMVLIVSGVSSMLHVSLLLTNMIFGAVIVNMLPEYPRVFSALSQLEPPLYTLFFTIAGAGLHISVLFSIGAVGIGYILARALGKIVGAALGAFVTHAPAPVQRYLGIALLPQAGVAIGLTMLAGQEFPEIKTFLTTLVLAAVVIYELVGPLCAKIAIFGAHEMGKRDELAA